jgi:hypothetical protein
MHTTSDGNQYRPLMMNLGSAIVCDRYAEYDLGLASMRCRAC